MATRFGLGFAGFSHPAVHLVTEILVGALAYVLAALVVCRATVTDLLQLLRRALKR